jgi:hypothetical protein
VAGRIGPEWAGARPSHEQGSARLATSDFRPINRSQNGSAAPTWEVVHLATGHAIIEVVGGLRAAQGAAEGLLALGDWTFTSIDGWRNGDPDLVGRVRAWVSGRPDLQLAGGTPRLETVALEIGRSG